MKQSALLRSVLGPLMSGTHSVQGTLRSRVYPIHSSQLNWTYAATYIQFNWVEVRASAFQISRLNFCWFAFPGLFFQPASNKIPKNLSWELFSIMVHGMIIPSTCPTNFADIGYENSPSLVVFPSWFFGLASVLEHLNYDPWSGHDTLNDQKIHWKAIFHSGPCDL